MCGALSKHKLVLEEETAAGMFSKQGKNMFTAGHFYLKLIGSNYKMFSNKCLNCLSTLPRHYITAYYV